jgi:hypothetical protein
MPSVVDVDSYYGAIYQDAQGCYIINPDTGAAEAWGCPTSSTVPATQPKVLTNVGGTVIKSGQTTLDKILGTVLSLAALSKNAPYVPTEVQPNQYGGGYNTGIVNPNSLGARAVSTEIANNNALGTLEAWVKTHPIPVAIAVAVGVAYLIPSPRQRR